MNFTKIKKLSLLILWLIPAVICLADSNSSTSNNSTANNTVNNSTNTPTLNQPITQSNQAQDAENIKKLFDGATYENFVERKGKAVFESDYLGGK